MLGKEDFTKIISDLKSLGHDITVTDIMFCIVETHVSSAIINYTAFYGKGYTSQEVAEYVESAKMKSLREYMRANYLKSNDGNITKEKLKDISFEQNKAELVKRLDDLKRLADSGEIDKKDAIKIEIDIRAKLNDKFGTTEKNEEQRVIVLQKMDDVCPKCGSEIYRPTRKDIIRDLENEGYKIVKA